MKKALLLFTLFGGAAVAQTFHEHTAVDRYYLDGVRVSQHDTERGASERAGNLNLTNPDSAVVSNYDHEIANTPGDDGNGLVASAPTQLTSDSDPGRDSKQDPMPPATSDEGYPKIWTVRIGNRAYAEDNDEGGRERAAIAKFNGVTLGLFYPGPWDRGESGYLSRAEILADLKARNSNLIIADYTDLMEKRDVPGPLTDWINQANGPGGTDGWAWKDADKFPRDPDNNRVSTFPNNFNINITDYVAADSNGDRYPQIYAQSQIDNRIRLSGGNLDAIYVDVFDIRPRTSKTDFDGDGKRDNARRNYANGKEPGFTIARKWREGQAAYINAIRAEHPNMMFLVNLTSWSRGYEDGSAPELFDAYKNLVHGGQQEGQSLRVVSPRRRVFPLSGVRSDGRINPDAAFGSYQLSINAMHYAHDNSLDPKLVFNDWHVNLGPTDIPDSPNGIDRWTNLPTSGTWNLFRWGLTQSLMGNVYHQVRGEPGGYASSPGFDEYGTVNQDVTGLKPGWLGLPTDPIQRIPRYRNVWIRYYENGVAISCAKNDSTQSPCIVKVTGANGLGAGNYKRLKGFQDSLFNDGSLVIEDFPLNAVDGVVLMKQRL